MLGAGADLRSCQFVQGCAHAAVRCPPFPAVGGEGDLLWIGSHSQDPLTFLYPVSLQFNECVKSHRALGTGSVL